MSESLTFGGLTRIDCKELEELMDSKDLTFDKRAVRPGEFGELGTIVATVFATKLAIAALAAWASRRQKPIDVAGKKRYVFRQSVKMTKKDGTMVEKELYFEADSESSLKEGVATQLANAFDLDVAEVLKLAKGKE